jgi:hypothetical protein
VRRASNVLAASIVLLLIALPSSAITRTWTGVFSGAWSATGNWSPVGIPASGDSLVFPPGVPNLWMTNDLPSGTVGPMTFNASAYTIDGNPLTLTGDVVNTAGPLLVLVPLTIGAPVRLTGSYATDKIDVNGQTLTIDGPMNINSLNGSGTVNVVQIFPPLTLIGDGTFNGTINGSIRVGGSMPNANVIIGGGQTGGHTEEVIGAGTLGNVTLNGGSLQPLNFGGGSAVIHTKSLAINDGDYDVQLATNGVSSAVQVSGTVFLNSSLGVIVSGSPVLGQTFTIIDNDGTDPVVGTFHGAPEGAIIPSSYLLKISYAGGDGNDVVLTTVGGTATTATQSSAATSYGDPVTVTATVTSDAGTPPGGLVIFYEGAATVAIITAHNGTATWTTSDLGVGTHNITAVYQPSHLYFGSTAAVVTHQVQQRVTTTAIGTSNAAVRFGDAVTFTATVGPAGFVAAATGTISFEVDGVSIGSIPVTNGSAALVTSVLAPGVHSVVAKYSGDPNFTPSASGVLGETVARARTEVRADLFPNTPVAGQLLVKVAVTVTDHPSLTATGKVTVSENGATLAEETLIGGGATVNMPGLPAGHHQLVVSYSGDPNFEPSSASVEQTVLLPQLSVSSIAIAEGNAGTQVVELLVQLSEPSSKIVRVAYTTIDGSARAGMDYEMSRGVLEFPPGEVARSIELHVFGDTIPEPDQTFAVVLSDPANADIANGIGTVTILNDDGPVTGPPRRRPSRH